MPGFPGQRGFTLVELGLAIAVGVVLLFAGMLAFDAARDATGDSIARSKVAALQTLVEQDYSANNAFPDIDSVRGQWLAERPDDATSSPWGGPQVDTETGDPCGNPPIRPTDGIRGGDLAGPCNVIGDVTTQIPDESNSSGVLYYYRINVPGYPVPTCCWSFQDDSRGPSGRNAPNACFTEAAGYMVAANKNFHCFYFITSGRGAPAACVP